jgi:hypothetical protein
MPRPWPYRATPAPDGEFLERFNRSNGRTASETDQIVYHGSVALSARDPLRACRRRSENQRSSAARRSLYENADHSSQG